MATFQNTGIRSAHGVGARNTGMSWWVIAFLPLGSPWTFKVFHGTKRQADQQASLAENGQALGPFATQSAAENAAKRHPQNPNAKPVISGPNPLSWFAQATGGVLAAALEQGFIQIIKDVWAVIEGPVEVIGGVLIIVVTLAIYFRGGIAGTALSVARFV